MKVDIKRLWGQVGHIKKGCLHQCYISCGENIVVYNPVVCVYIYISMDYSVTRRQN